MKKRLSECNGKAEGRDAGLDPAIGLAESLPETWIVVPFVRSIDDKRVQIIKVQQAKYKNAGQFPIIDQGQKMIAGYWDDERDVYRGRLPVIVFGDHTRAFKFVDFPFVAGADGTHVLAPCADRFDPYFLYLTFSLLDIPSRGYNRHFRFLKERTVVAPPLPEQRAIAAVLRTVQRTKEACEKVIAATRALKQSLLHYLFTYGPVPFDQADPVALKQTEVGMVPKAWQLVKFGDVVDIASGQVNPRHSPYIEMLHVGPENIEPGTGRLLNPSTAGELGLISGKYVFTEKDVIYSKIRPYLRKAAMALFTGVCSADMYPLRPHDRLDNKFLLHWLLSDSFTNVIVPNQARTGIPKVNREQLNSTHLPLPPLTTQRTIASHLSVVDAKLVAEEKRRAALDNLFQSLLHNLMTGRVRVNHLFDELVGADPRVGPVASAHGGASLRGGNHGTGGS